MLPDLKVVSQSGNKFVLYLFKVSEFNLMGVPDVKGDAFGIWGIIQLNWDDVLVLSGNKEEDSLLAQSQEVFPQTVLSDECRVYTVSNE